MRAAWGPSRISLLAFALLLAACGGGEPGPAPDPTGEATASPTGVDEDPGQGGSIGVLYHNRPLLPGRYRTQKFSVPFTLAVSKPNLSARFIDSRTFLEFRSVETNQPVLRVVRISQVWDPREARYVSAPRDLAAWLGRHPLLDAGKPSITMIGETIGTQLDADVTEVVRGGEEICGEGVSDTACLPLTPRARVRNGFPPIAFSLGERIRIYLLETPGSPLVFLVHAPPEQFQQTVQAAEEVVSSVEFGGP